MQFFIRSLRYGLLALIGALALSGLSTLATYGQASTPQYLLGTYLGGPSSDYGRAVAVDAQGNIYVAGDIFSSTFSGYDIQKYGGRDVLVLKFSPDGKEVLGGFSAGTPGSDEVLDMVITPAGEPILTIYPGGAWPTSNALNSEPTRGNEGVLLKINAALDAELFSTYTLFDISNSGGQNIDLDANGNIYLTGDRYGASTVARDLIVQKYSPNGQQLLYEKIWNNDETSENGYSIDVLPDGSAYVTGVVSGYDSKFPVTPDALQKLCGRELALGADRSCDDDAFLVILNPDGSTRYASYLGGQSGDHGVSIAVDGQGGVVIVGPTASTDFPTTQGAPLAACKRDGQDNFCYYDTFVTRFNPGGQSIAYSSYLNSNDTSSLDFTSQVVADASGNATILGRTSGELFPVKDPIQGSLAATPCVSSFTRFCYDSFITTLSPSGALLFSSYLGGSNDEEPEDIFLGLDGSLYLTGSTESANYPVVEGARQPNYSGGSDYFLARIGLPSGSTPNPTPSPIPSPTPDPALQTFKLDLPLIRQ